jgi:hypothetical protein
MNNISNTEIEVTPSPRSLVQRTRNNNDDNGSQESSSSECCPHDYKDFLPITSTIVKYMTKKLTSIFVMVMLAYHLFVHLWIGSKSGGAILFQGFMYFSNYAAVSVAYWIMFCLHKTWMSCKKTHDNVIIDQHYRFHPQLFHHINKSFLNFPGRQNRYGDEYLLKIKESCQSWEKSTMFFYFLWLIPTFVNIGRRIIKLYNGSISSEDRLHESPWGLYGFYNLIGQFLAALCIIPVANVMVTGFFQIKTMILFWIHNIRQSRDNENSQFSYNSEKDAKKDYLHLQSCLVNFSLIWSIPILATFVLSTQVILSNLILLYKLTSFNSLKHREDCGDTCQFPILYPIIWLVVGCGIFMLILLLVSDINSVGQNAKDAFIYAQDSDYKTIGNEEKPRQTWIDYLNSNPLQLKISGLVISHQMVVKTLYPCSVALGSLFFSSLLE